MSKCKTKIREYTLELVFKVFPYPSAIYGKVIDFNNRSKNNGLYVFYGKNKGSTGSFIQFSPGGGSGESPFIDNEYNQVVISRDLTETVKVYLNGVKQFEFDDYDKLAVIETDHLLFFKDDVISNDKENFKFLVSKINMYPKTLTETEVSNLPLFHGIISNCPTGTPEPTYTPLPTATPEYCIKSIQDIPDEIYIYKDCPSEIEYKCTTEISASFISEYFIP